MHVAAVQAAVTRHVGVMSAFRPHLQGFRTVDLAVLWPKGYTQFHSAHMHPPLPEHHPLTGHPLPLRRRICCLPGSSHAGRSP